MIHSNTRSAARSARHGLVTLIAIAAWSASAPGTAFAQPITNPAVQPSGASAATRYGQLPLSFIANAGQADGTIRFQVRDSHGLLSFADSGVTLRLPTTTPNTTPKRSMAAIALTFRGANPAPALVATDRLSGIANFIIGRDPAKWQTNVPTYGGLDYRALYPGIDLHYGGHSGLLKGTYTIAPGGDPALIRWQYTGIDSARIDPQTANLDISALGGISLIEQAPIAWQRQAGGLRSVAVRYRIAPDGSIGFAIADGAYDRSQPLTIDPGLDYSTYLGGSGDDEGTAIAVDSSGNAYITGMTDGSLNTGASFPATSGAYQSYLNNSDDAFISKLNAAGTALIYSTYLGGSAYDQANAIAVDSSGNVVIAGYTASNDFPVTGSAYQNSENNGSIDGFITKLNSTGSGLIYSTYLGGSDFDAISGLALDSAGDAFVTGLTASSDFPTTAGAPQTAFGGGASDAFITKLNSTGSTLIYSTYLGGVGNDAARAIALDGGGGAYITGLSSGAFPLTSGAFQTSFRGGSTDAFVTKLYPGGSIAYSTYLGGTGNDEGAAIAVDGSGSVFVAGDTASTDYPVISGSYQTVSGGGTEAFVTRLNSAGSGLIYSTYLGGLADTQATGLALDSSENAIITGFTSGALPVTAQPFQIALGGGGSDAFVARLNTAGTALTYSTYLGGTGVDAGLGLARDSSQNVYVVGQTGGGFPVSAGAYATTYGGLSTDAFISKLTLPTADVPRIDTIGIDRSGTFLLRLHNTTGPSELNMTFNPSGQNLPIVGDWAGMGYDTVGVYDRSGGRFALCTVNVTASCANGANQITFVLGNPNDTPLSGRWIYGATHAGAGVYRPSNGILYMKNALVTGYSDFSDVLGNPGDVGVAGDWTGQGFDSPGVYRPGSTTFYLSNKVTNGIVFSDLTATYGTSTDLPVIGDWVGQGHDGIGMFRSATGYVFLKNAITTGVADNSFYYGANGDLPIAGHWQVVYPSIALPPALHPTPQPGSISVPGGNQIGG